MLLNAVQTIKQKNDLKKASPDTMDKDLQNLNETFQSAQIMIESEEALDSEEEKSYLDDIVDEEDKAVQELEDDIEKIFLY